MYGHLEPDPRLPYVHGGTGHANYEHFLQHLVQRSAAGALPAAADGVLRVSVPFCGAFSEAELVAGFAERQLLAQPRIGAVFVFATDVEPEPFLWQKWLELYRNPRLSVVMRQWDLAAAPMPLAALTLAVHPRPLAATAEARATWARILRNVLRGSAPGGLCAFGVFIRQEADEVVRMCSEAGAQCEPIVECPLRALDPKRTSKEFALDVLAPGTDYLGYYVLAWTAGLS